MALRSRQAHCSGTLFDQESFFVRSTDHKKYRMKKIIISFIIIVLAGTAVFPRVLFADLPPAVTYLQSQPLDDWSAQALVAAGSPPSDEEWLQGFTSSGVTAVEKRILTLAALGHDPSSFYSGRDLVAEITSGAFQDGQIGDASLLNDDMFGVLALASVNRTEAAAFTAAAAYIVSHQNADGGWSYAVGQPSDTNDTAIAIMALLETGQPAAGTVITNAIAYLQSVQNSDHGWGWDVSSGSDSASTAWAISALVKAGSSVSAESYAWLNTLQTGDGSFKWLPSDQSGSVIMTAYAVMALDQSYFPVKKLAATPTAGNYLRIEGSGDTVCTGYFTAANALQLVAAAAAECGFTYEIEQTSFGPYLKRINGDEAAGTDGWLYRVNWLSPAVGANDYVLQPGDEILWYFGDWQLIPLELTLNTDTIESGGSVTATVRYIDGSDNWQSAAGATVRVGTESFTTDSNGRAELTFSQDGVFTVRAGKDGHVRSNPQSLTVGSGLSDTVGWQVDIDGSGGSPELSFAVVTERIDFGKLKKGERKSMPIVIQNDGSVPVYLEAVLTGDQQLLSGFRIDETSWSDFNRVITAGNSATVNAQLTVPGSFSGSGIRSGDIVFWGTGAN